MDWMNEVKIKLQRKNHVLFDKNSSYLRDLTVLFEMQKHRVMVLWALDFAAGSVASLEEKYPDEKRPREALEAAWDWASGKIKMRPHSGKFWTAMLLRKKSAARRMLQPAMLLDRPARLSIPPGTRSVIPFTT